MKDEDDAELESFGARADGMCKRLSDPVRTAVCGIIDVFEFGC